MDEKISSIVDKVQKLFALSKSSNPHEAATAAAMANKLIDQYRLKEVDLEDNSGMWEDPNAIYTTGRVTPWKADLVGILANHYGCAHYIQHNNVGGKSGHRRVSSFKLIGNKIDILIAKYMFAWLTIECQRLCDENAKGKGHVYAASYCFGFVDGIQNQLKASRKEVVGDNPLGLIKFDNRMNAANALMEKLHPKLTKATGSKSQLSLNGYGTGKKVGSNFHLGQSLGSGNNTKLLGK